MWHKIKTIPLLMWQDIKRFIPIAAAAVIFLTLLNLSFGTTCTLALFTGYPCPACGMTRASLLLARGQLADAGRMHPVLLFILFGLFLEGYWKYWLNKKFPYRRVYIAIVILISMVLYIYRMVNWFPFIEPMTYRQENILNFIIKVIESIKR